MKKSIYLLTLAALAFSCGGKTETATTEAPPAASTETTAPAPTETPPAPAATPVMVGKLDGAEWKAGPMGVSEQYYLNGSKMLGFKVPTLVLVFVSQMPNDTRQILIYARNFQGKPGVMADKDVDVTLSGEAGGKNFLASNAQGTKRSPFSLEITKWEKKSDTQALVSGKLSGDVPPMLGSNGGKVEDGVFTDLSISIVSGTM